jgi:hypothetical protein
VEYGMEDASNSPWSCQLSLVEEGRSGRMLTVNGAGYRFIACICKRVVNTLRLFGEGFFVFLNRYSMKCIISLTDDELEWYRGISLSPPNKDYKILQPAKL